MPWREKTAGCGLSWRVLTVAPPEPTCAGTSCLLHAWPDWTAVDVTLSDWLLLAMLLAVS